MDEEKGTGRRVSGWRKLNREECVLGEHFELVRADEGRNVTFRGMFDDYLLELANPKWLPCKKKVRERRYVLYE